ncbi:MAG TPA: AAA family ATPase [Candidatus Dojkabacteria bacterium]|nr:AAA family ATPase [Candidatus Dojkabacteria bacterium]
MIYFDMEFNSNTLQSNTTNDMISEIVQLQNKLSSSNVPVELKEGSMRAIQRLERMAKWGNYSSEFEGVDKYIDWITRVPWGVVSEDNLDIQNARQLLDSTHYGMDTVKEMILDYLATMQLKKITKNRGIGNQDGNIPTIPTLLFVGLQGIGKTTIAQSIAKAMGRKFARVSLGAVGDVRTLRGVPRHEMDSEPGQIIKALVRTGTMNPVILVDEIEKSSQNKGIHNDIMAALLEILDPEQNANFVDHYIDYPVDLSQVFFICTANNLGGLSAALLDRLEVIRFMSYTDQEKEVIAKSYILPKVFANMGLSSDYIQISQEVWPLLIRPVGFDAGIRQLERNIATLARSAAREIVSGKPVPIVITAENLKKYVLPDQGPLS